MAEPTVILADDDGGIRTVISRALSRQGYQVQATATAATLWRWIEDGTGDVAIVDVVLPDENTLDLLPRIKQRRPGLPIIVMSAQNTLLTAVRATERGAFDYLPKPFDLGHLVTLVKRALALPRTTRGRARGPGPVRGAAADHRPVGTDAGDLPDHRPPDGHRSDRDDQRRVRHRQGAGGARHARLRQASRRAVHRRQHGGDPARADRERAVRPREGRVHRRQRAQDRPLRAGRGRHAVPRRDRRHAARGPDPPAARAAVGRIHAGRRPQPDPGNAPDHRRDPPRPPPAGRARACSGTICSTG